MSRVSVTCREALVSAVLASCLLSSVALGGTKFVGGGLKVSHTAPIYRPLATWDQNVSLTQTLYTQADLGFPTRSRIIDVAWRKEGLGTSIAPGCDIDVWMKNVSAAVSTYAEGSSVTLTDAQQDGQRVFSARQVALPNTMGFVQFAATENALAFDYTGGNLEVLVVADCRGASATDRALFWRYDDVPGRVRTFTSTTLAADSRLSAEPGLSSMRPHTRFRFLEPGQKLFVRVGTTSLPNGGTFALAPQHVALGAPNLFAFVLSNEGVDPIVVNAVGFSNLINGSAATSLMANTVLPPNSVTNAAVDFTPVAVGPMGLRVTWSTSSGNHVNTFQGPVNAVPAPQPAASLLRADDSQLTLSAQTVTVVDEGVVAADEAHRLSTLGSNYGHTTINAAAEVVSTSPNTQATVLTSPRPTGAKEDSRFETVVRSAAGASTTTLRTTVGGASHVVTVNERAVAPNLEVSGPRGPVPPGLVDRYTPPSLRTADRYPLEYVVRNTGDAALHVLKVEAKGEGCDVEVVRLPKRVLERGESAPLSVSVIPREPKHQISFEVVSSDQSPTVYAWRAQPDYPGSASLNVINSDIEEVSRGKTYEAQSNQLMIKLMLTNLGAEDSLLEVTSVEVPSCDGCEASAPGFKPVSLRFGESTRVPIALRTPKDFARYAVTFAITSNDPAGVFTFTLKGDTGANGTPNSTFCGRCSSTGAWPFVWGLVWMLSRRRRSAGGREGGADFATSGGRCLH